MNSDAIAACIDEIGKRRVVTHFDVLAYQAVLAPVSEQEAKAAITAVLLESSFVDPHLLRQKLAELRAKPVLVPCGESTCDGIWHVGDEGGLVRCGNLPPVSGERKPANQLDPGPVDYKAMIEEVRANIPH